MPRRHGAREVRGGAPGTRETDLLRPGMLVQEVNAVSLAVEKLLPIWMV